MTSRAVFLDKDGTLVQDVPYNVDPQLIEPAEGALDALRLLGRAGYQLVVVSNQSGVARGLFPETALLPVEEKLRDLFAQAGAELAGFYFCPHHPQGSVSEYAVECACRKPKPGMLLRAAAELDLDLARSWMIGDILDDVEAGHRAGCRSILVDLGTESLPTDPLRAPDFVARDTVHALEIVAGERGLCPTPDLAYRPAGWLLPSMQIASYVVFEAGGVG
jgi:D,D-heptose 1,7-bisphosphate phosphatase